MEKGVDVNAKDKHGFSAFGVAIQNGNFIDISVKMRKFNCQLIDHAIGYELAALSIADDTHFQANQKDMELYEKSEEKHQFNDDMIWTICVVERDTFIVKNW